MATQHVGHAVQIKNNLYREENISLVSFFLPLKRDKNVWRLQPPFSTWRPLAFLPVILSLLSYFELFPETYIMVTTEVFDISDKYLHSEV